MSKFIKLQEYDRRCRNYFDLWVNINQIVAVSPDSNVIHTTATTGSGDGVFCISEGSMLDLLEVLGDIKEREK